MKHHRYITVNPQITIKGHEHSPLNFRWVLLAHLVSAFLTRNMVAHTVFNKGELIKKFEVKHESFNGRENV